MIIRTSQAGREQLMQDLEDHFYLLIERLEALCNLAGEAIKEKSPGGDVVVLLETILRDAKEQTKNV